MAFSSASLSKPKYKKIDPIEHVLLRSTMYIGSTANRSKEFFGVNDEAQSSDEKHSNPNPVSIRRRQGPINDGLRRIFIEILSNAVDNKWRSLNSDTPQTKIKVQIDDDGRVTVWNDGLTIPIEVDPTTGLYNPELIFGHLLSSSNYDDEVDRYTGGMNGLGAKLTCIFSQEFSVKVVDTFTKKQYTQTWRNNMCDKGEPKITASAAKTGYTQISFVPDFARFGVTNFDADMRSLLFKDVIDAAANTRLKVYFNDVELLLKDLRQYFQLYCAPGRDPTSTGVIYLHRDSEFALVLSDDVIGGWNAVSFVNGIETPDGGVHVDAFTEALLRPVLERLNKKNDKPLTLRDIKPYFNLFLVCNLNKPKFSSQEKVKLTEPVPPASWLTIDAKCINAIMKFGAIQQIKDSIESKEWQSLKKIENKNKGFKKIEKYEKANFAGVKTKFRDTFLALTEGDSAATFVVSGLTSGIFGKKGRDYIGLYPMRGVIMNVRGRKADLIAKNKEIQDIIQILNLKTGLDYTDDKNFDTLTYGHLVIVCDADTDALHIASLIANLIHYLFPTLLKRSPSFLLYMRTPIIRVRLPRQTLDFYAIRDFKKYQESVVQSHAKLGQVKYYKGLGTSTKEEAKEFFGRKMIAFCEDDLTRDTMNKVFDPKCADLRKQWIQSYDPSIDTETVSSEPVQQLSLTDFLNNEMITFSIEDCERSIPHVMDGLKPSQRKILYACFLKNLRSQIKVAQLSGFVAEKTGYHHGEMSLHGAIIKMAQNFVGSNNVNLLAPVGQFGSRSKLGNDAASARYTFTHLCPITEVIFNRDDEPNLTHRVDDGEPIEWEWFVPCLPMVLVNGVSGIGTGFSSSIPLYNPLDMIAAIRAWLDEQPLPELMPWYHGFRGTMVKLSDKKFVSKGVVTRTNNRVTVTEIPVGMSIDAFRDSLDDLLEAKKIKNYQNYSSEDNVHFEISEYTTDDAFFCTLDNLKLTSPITTTNMVCFDHTGRLHKYDSPQEILLEYCVVRLDFYARRKESLLVAKRHELRVLVNKRRFLDDIVGRRLTIANLSDTDVTALLAQKGFEDFGEGFGYLLNMSIRSFTADKLADLGRSIETLTAAIEALEHKTSGQLWLDELSVLEKILVE